MWGEVGGVELFQPAGIFFVTSTASTGFLFRGQVPFTIFFSFFFFSGVGDSTVAHNSISLLKDNNLFENTTVVSGTQQSFRKHSKIFQNTKIFFRTQRPFLAHSNLFKTVASQS